MDPTDPTSWPLWIKLLAGWGPLGVWVARAELARGRVERAHHATRDGHDATIAKINEAHAAELRDLNNRFVKLIEKQAAATRVLTDRVREKQKGGQ